MQILTIIHPITSRFADYAIQDIPILYISFPPNFQFEWLIMADL